MSVSYARFVESNDLKYALVYYTTQSSCQMLGMVPFILLKPVKNDQVFFQIIVFAEIGTFEFPCLPLLSGRLHVSHGLSADLTSKTEVLGDLHMTVYLFIYSNFIEAFLYSVASIWKFMTSQIDCFLQTASRLS